MEWEEVVAWDGGYLKKISLGRWVLKALRKLLLQKGGFCAKASPWYEGVPKPLVLEDLP